MLMILFQSIVDFLNPTQLASPNPELDIEKGGNLSDCFFTKANIKVKVAVFKYILADN